MTSDALEISRQIIAVHSKSFALASRLLPRRERDRAVVVYAWCRRADDAVDHAQHVVDERIEEQLGAAAADRPAVQRRVGADRAGAGAKHATGEDSGRAALAALRQELDAVYSGGAISDPILEAFRHVTETCRVPRLYPEELLEGLAMDVESAYYDTLPTLLRYCYRVAGTVGLMMCHVMRLQEEAATRNAVHLGVAMQLTNICRDVAEDWERGRLYLPEDLLARHGCVDLYAKLGGPFPRAARRPVALVIGELLDRADEYYRSGDAGIHALSWRCGLAIRTARRVYAAIGERIRAAGCDPFAGRAWVSSAKKIALAGRAVAAAAGDFPRTLQRRAVPLEAPRREVRAEHVLPLGSGNVANRGSEPTCDDRRAGAG
jgi:phytoene synthase